MNSNAVDMMGPIHSDLFFQERLLLNGVNLRIRLNRTKNTFCLVSSAAAPQFKVVIIQAILYVRKVNQSRTCGRIETSNSQVSDSSNRV